MFLGGSKFIYLFSERAAAPARIMTPPIDGRGVVIVTHTLLLSCNQ